MYPIRHLPVVESLTIVGLVNRSITRRRAGLENLLVVVVVGLFAAWLCFIPPKLLESADYLIIWRPSFRFLMDALTELRLPLWNPYLNLGRPYLADMPNMALYPPTHLVCLGEGPGLFLQIWLHCLLAVFGMRKLASVLGVGRWQAYLMAGTFVTSGALTARWAAGHLPNCWAICYLPWLLYCAARAAEPWRARRMALYAVLLAGQLLCHPQVFWFSVIGQTVFILARSVRRPFREGARDAGRGLWHLGVACAWCGGLLAVVLLPFLELVKESNRSVSSTAFANAFNLDLRDLRSLFGPLQGGAVWETNFFVGTLIVVLGLAGLSRLREPNVRGLVAMAVVGLLLALGDQTPFFNVFYKWLPGYAGFRFHSREAVLAVLALICAAGIWLSRPHPLLRALWTGWLGLPVHYAIVLLVLLQGLDLLQGVWITRKVILYACNVAVGVPCEHSYEKTILTELRNAGLMRPSLPPPRVCMPPPLAPAANGMIYHYSHFDAGCALSLRRPWDYLHAVLRLTPSPSKGELPLSIYDRGPFPYPDLNLAAGFDPHLWKLVLATNPAPRAFLVYAAEVADYNSILKRLAGGYDVHRSALLEAALPQTLPGAGALPGKAVTIGRFEPNWLAMDVEASTNALVVLAEAWHPGWCAEVDGQPAPCVPANGWMRAVPVTAGRHQVRVYFRQDYLLVGLVISLVSLGLLWVVAARRPQLVPLAPPEGGRDDVGREPAPKPGSGPGAVWAYCLLARLVAAGCAAVLVWLAVKAERQQLRLFEIRRAELESLVQSRIGAALVLQRRTDDATVHYVEALRLAKRACGADGLPGADADSSPWLRFMPISVASMRQLLSPVGAANWRSSAGKRESPRTC